MSKGSNRRPTDYEKFAVGWDRIFGKKKKKKPAEVAKKIAPKKQKNKK